MEQWVRQLVLLVVLAGLAEALLPRSDLRRYAETVVGLLVLLTVLQPALGLVRTGFDWEATLGSPAAGLGDGSAVERLREVQRGLVLDAFRHRAAVRVREVVEEVPGVGKAAVAVRVAEDPGRPDYARIVEAVVEAEPESGSAVDVPAVREAVRRELGLPADRVRVRVREPAGPGGEDGLGGGRSGEGNGGGVTGGE